MIQQRHRATAGALPGSRSRRDARRLLHRLACCASRSRSSRSPRTCRSSGRYLRLRAVRARDLAGGLLLPRPLPEPARPQPRRRGAHRRRGRPARHHAALGRSSPGTGRPRRPAAPSTSPTAAPSSASSRRSTCCCVATARMAVRSVPAAARRSGHNLQRILVVGAGMLGREIAKKLLDHRELGLRGRRLPRRRSRQGRHRCSAACRCSAPLARTRRRARRRDRIDQVYIALPLEAHKKMLRAPRARWRSECVEVKLVPDILQYATLKADARGPRRHAGDQSLAGAAAGLEQPGQARHGHGDRGRPRCSSSCCPCCRSSRSPSGSRTAARSSTARSAWASTAARS